MGGRIPFINDNVNEVMDNMMSELSAAVGETLYPGDERRIFGEALAAALIQMYAKLNDSASQRMLRYARGSVLDALGERVDTKRLPPGPSYTTIRFRLSAVQSMAVVIPPGIKTSAGKVYFVTTEIGVIPAGELFVDVPSQSEKGGAQYNGLPVNSINALVNLIPYVDGVMNLSETTGGTDGEPYTEEGDDHYRERIRAAPTKYSTAGPREAYKYWAKTADARIETVAVYSMEPGHVTIMPLYERGVFPEQKVMDTVYAVCNDEKIRPITDFVHVEHPEVVFYDIAFTYYVRAEEENIVVANVEGEGGAISKYMNWQDGTIGRDINPDQLRREVLCPNWADIPTGALRLDVNSPSYQMIKGEVEAGYSRQKAQIARWSGVMHVNHQVVEE